MAFCPLSSPCPLFCEPVAEPRKLFAEGRWVLKWCYLNRRLKFADSRVSCKPHAERRDSAPLVRWRDYASSRWGKGVLHRVRPVGLWEGVRIPFDLGGCAARGLTAHLRLDSKASVKVCPAY